MTIFFKVIYLLVVTRPMALETVEKRLASGWYWDASHCLRDIQQVKLSSKDPGARQDRQSFFWLQPFL